MRVQATESCFIGGSRRREGDVFDIVQHIIFPSPCLKLIDESATVHPAAPVVSDTNPLETDELRVRLGELGIKVHPAMGRDKLLLKLAEAEGR
jgi:hypothetical protein